MSSRLCAWKFHRFSFFDILEWKRSYLSFADDLVLLVRLCGYLLIKSNVIHMFLVNLLSLDEARTLKSVSVLPYELYWNGFLASSEHFSQGVDHTYFYGLLKNYLSYRNVKCKLRSFYRYWNFVRTYTYPSSRVKFSRVRAAFFLGLSPTTRKTLLFKRVVISFILWKLHWLLLSKLAGSNNCSDVC